MFSININYNEPIGIYKGHNVYAKDLMIPYTSSSGYIKVESEYIKHNFSVDILSKKSNCFLIPTHTESDFDSEKNPSGIKFLGYITVRSINNTIRWEKNLSLPIFEGIKMLFNYYKENIEEQFTKQGIKSIDGFGTLICTMYYRHFKVGFRCFWAHHVQQIFKDKPQGDISIYNE